jgi:hypothetical protein
MQETIKIQQQDQPIVASALDPKVNPELMHHEFI